MQAILAMSMWLSDWLSLGLSVRYVVIAMGETYV